MSPYRKAMLLVPVLLLLASASAQDLEVRQGDKILRRYSLAELKKLAAPQVIKLDEGQRNYWAVPLRPLLEKSFGASAYGGDTSYVFVCRDGYRSPVKAQEIQKYPVFLAFASRDGKPFRHEGHDLAPFYLVWDTQAFPERKKAGAWPYQIVAIERISYQQAYSATLPPPQASAQVQKGYLLFRKHCLSCHQMNGQGGNMAPDLNSPYSVTEYIHKPFLVKLIDNPQGVRARASMPALDRSLPNRAQAIADIVAYLEAKAAQRRASKSAKLRK